MPCHSSRSVQSVCLSPGKIIMSLCGWAASSVGRCFVVVASANGWIFQKKSTNVSLVCLGLCEKLRAYSHCNCLKRTLEALGRVNAFWSFSLKEPPPLDLSFWSFLTFLHHGIEEVVERHILWKFPRKNQRKSWSKCATEVARLHKVSIQSCTQNRPSPKVQSCSGIEFNFFIAWTIFMKLGTRVHHVCGYKRLPQIF